MIETLANWGEFIGGLGIVVSLIYVGIQLRTSVSQARVDSYTKTTELWSNFTSTIASNEETWRIFHQGMYEYETLNPTEQARFGFLISMYFGLIDNIMNAKQAGFQEAETYRRNLEAAYAIFNLAGVQKWFKPGRIFAPNIEEYMVSRKRAETEEAVG